MPGAGPCFACDPSAVPTRPHPRTIDLNNPVDNSYLSTGQAPPKDTSGSNNLNFDKDNISWKRTNSCWRRNATLRRDPQVPTPSTAHQVRLRTVIRDLPTKSRLRVRCLQQTPTTQRGWRRLIDWVEKSGDIEKPRAAFDVPPAKDLDEDCRQLIECLTLLKSAPYLT